MMKDKGKKIISAMATLALHFFIIFSLFHIVVHKKKSLPHEEIVSIQIIPKQASKTDNRKVIKADTKGSIRDNGKCKTGTQYFGVGIVYMMGKVIVTVSPGYPAYDAHIHPYDIIINMSKDPEGYTDFLIQRGNEVLKFRVKNTMICIGPNKSPIPQG